VLRDGRLAYVQRCWVSLSPTRRIPEERANLMVYDPRTGDTGHLVPYYLPVNANFFDYAPDAQRGVINDGNGLHESLYWLLPDRLERLTLPLERAGYPSWSPDGQWIAVDGAPDQTKTRAGVARLDLPRN